MKTLRTKSVFLAVLCLLTALLFSSCGVKTSVVWTEGEKDPATGRAIHTLKVVNAPEGTDWKVWMTSNYIASGSVVEGTQGEVALFHGCLYHMTPYEHESQDLVVTYRDIPLQRHCWAPEGFVLEKGSKQIPLDVKYGSSSATSDGGAVRLTIVNREKTADEKLDDKITDITDILAMLLMGGAEDGEESN